MKKLSLGDLKKQLLRDRLFGKSDKIKILEAIIDTKKNTINSASYEMSSESFDNGNYEYNLIKNEKSDSLFICRNDYISDNKKYSNEVTVSFYINHISVKSKIADLPADNKEVTEIKFTLSDKMEDNGFNIFKVNVIAVHSQAPCILRIAGFENIEDAREYKFSMDIDSDEGLIYNSNLKNFDIRKDIIKRSHFSNIRIERIEEAAESIYLQSSLSKNEDIEYNENGEVIYYHNPGTGITMNVENDGGKSTKTIKVGDIILERYITKKSKYSITTEDYFGNRRIYKSISGDEGLYPINDPKATIVSYNIYNDGVCIFDDINMTTKFEDEIYESHIHIGDKIVYNGSERYVVTYDTNDFVDYISADKYEVNHLIEVRERFIDDKLILSRFFNTVQYHDADGQVIIKYLYTDNGIKRYSDISNIWYSVKEHNDCIYYRDNDIQVKLDKDNNILEFQSINPNITKDNVYLRDTFGIPYLLSNKK